MNGRYSSMLMSMLATACGLNTFGLDGSGTPGTSTSATTVVDNLTTSAASTSTSSADASTSETSTSAASTVASTGSDGECGNAVVEGAEECDDGDGDDHDACTNACTLAVCGDGSLGPGEVCDDGNTIDDDVCTNTCILATCGDGEVQAGEECDEDLVDTPTCDADCTFPACGDSHTNAAADEVCDLGGDSPVCDGDCTLPVCGDDYINPVLDEVCDDGNSLGGDACSVNCQPTEIVEVLAGYEHTCVRFASGAVRCWGLGLHGQTGHGDGNNTGDQPGEMPSLDIAAGDDIAQMCVGQHHTCARTNAGDVRCWGEGANGRLGYGNTERIGDAPGEMPPANVDVGEGAAQVVCGIHFTCVRTVSGTVRCWGQAPGYGNMDEVGDGPGEMPPLDVPGIVDVAELVAGGNHLCALTNAGEVFCWGLNLSGQLGHGTTDYVGDEPGEMPPMSTDAGGPVQHLAGGGAHTCALLDGGNVRCWGLNASGQLGTGDNQGVGDGPGEMPPKANINIGGAAEQVVAGLLHTCVRMVTGTVRCWGASFPYGQVGYPGVQSVEMPPKDVDVDVEGEDRVTMLASHWGFFTCAVLTVDGTMRCWGRNNYGQLGYGNTISIGYSQTPASAGPVPF